MRRLIAALLLLCLLCPTLAGCGKEKELEPWKMPEVDAKPTPVRTPIPTFGGGSPERFVWNEAAFFNMNNPGALKTSTQETRTHKQCMALFPYNFLHTSARFFTDIRMIIDDTRYRTDTVSGKLGNIFYCCHSTTSSLWKRFRKQFRYHSR